MYSCLKGIISLYRSGSFFDTGHSFFVFIFILLYFFDIWLALVINLDLFLDSATSFIRCFMVARPSVCDDETTDTSSKCILCTLFLEFPGF